MLRALRGYARTDPERVRTFVNTHELSPLFPPRGAQVFMSNDGILAKQVEYYRLRASE